MSKLIYNLSKKFDETYTISFIGGPQEIKDNGFVFKTETMNGIVNIKKFVDSTENETENIYFTKFFKYKNGDNWSDIISIDKIESQTFDPCKDLILEFYYYRTLNDNSSDSLYVDDIIISGEYALSVYDSEAELNNGDTVILAPKDTYKIFSLENFSVQAKPHNNYDIKFRFTQDNGRTYTQWESLTQENLSTHKISPIRFAKVEYSITNNAQSLLVYDIILEGDFQNVSANYLKTNRYGLKEDCITNMQNSVGEAGSSLINKNFHTQCLSNYQTNTDIAKDIDITNNESKSSFWNPYNYDKITSFSNLLGNQVSNIFGWTVDYHLTDPDGNGIDKYLHEYTLKNIVDVKKLKVIVPDNKFPVETIILNQFNLDLFDVFEIHIMKDEFKNKFGITKRPAQDDIIYICEANMLYYVKHSQAYKDIMNAATYYKVILEKYEHKTNIRNLVDESQELINSLTDNTTIEETISEDNRIEEKNIANKEQFYPTTFDKIRQKISEKVNILKDNVYVDNFHIIKNYYDLSYKYLNGKTAINYEKADNSLNKSDNRSFIFWFKFNDKYDEDLRPNTEMILGYNINKESKFYLLNNFDSVNNLGYNIYYSGNKLILNLNDQTYKLEQELLTNVWYAGIININQRQETLDIKIYKRNCEINTILINVDSFIKEEAIYNSTEYNNLINNNFKPLSNEENKISSDFILINNIKTNINPIDFQHSENLKVLGSNIKYSNLRILNDIVNNDKNILKEHILTEGSSVILADNANEQLITQNYYNKNFR